MGTVGSLNITTRVVIRSEPEDKRREQTDLGGDWVGVWVATSMMSSCELPKMLRKACPYLQSSGCGARPKAEKGGTTRQLPAGLPESTVQGMHGLFWN